MGITGYLMIGYNILIPRFCNYRGFGTLLENDLCFWHDISHSDIFCLIHIEYSCKYITVCHIAPRLMYWLVLNCISWVQVDSLTLDSTTEIFSSSLCLLSVHIRFVSFCHVAVSKHPCATLCIFFCYMDAGQVVFLQATCVEWYVEQTGRETSTTAQLSAAEKNFKSCINGLGFGFLLWPGRSCVIVKNGVW